VGSAPAGVGSSAVAVDPGTTTIYVGNGNNANGPVPGGNTVSVIDGRRCNALTVRGCAGPWPTVTVGNEPSTLTVDLTTHTVYVTNISDNTVSVIDGRTCNGRDSSGCDRPPTTVPVGSVPIGVFVDDATHTVYVGNFGDGTVSLIDSATCNGVNPAGCPTTPPPTVAVGDGPGDIDVNQRTHTAYVATLPGVTAFDTRTCNASDQTGCGRVGKFVLCPPDTCIGSFSAKVDEVNNTIYAGDGNTTIVAIDGRACTARNLAGCATAPFGRITLPPAGFEHVLFLAVDAPNHTVYALAHKDDAVMVIDANACNGAHRAGCATLIPKQIHTGTNPESISLDPRTHTLYVANELDNDVSVIDASRCNARVTVGCRPRPPSAVVPGAGGIAVDEAVRTAYVTSDGTAVAMIDTRRCNAFYPAGCGQAPATVDVGDFPQAIAIDGQTHTAYVATASDGDTGSLVVLDTRTCNARRSGCPIVATLPVLAGRPTATAVNSITDTVYVGTVTSDGANGVSVFNGGTCNASRSTGCGQSAARMIAGPTLGPALICGGYFVAVAVNERSNTVYVTNNESCGGQGDKVFVYDGAHCGGTETSGCGDALATVTAGLNPFSLAVDQATNTVYAPLLADGEYHGSVAVINGATCNGSSISGCDQTPALAPAGFGSIGVAVDPKTHSVYVTNIQDTSVSVIDDNLCNATNADHCNQATKYKLSVDDYPTGLAIDPTVGTAYVTSGVKGTVGVVRLKPSR